MTWRNLVLGALMVVLLLLVSTTVVLADTKVNLDELTKNRLAEAEKINVGCLNCHKQKQEGQGQAPFIDPQAYSQSVHSQIACIKCHDDAKEGTKPAVIVGDRNLAEKVDRKCQECHSEVSKTYEKSSHSALVNKEAVLCTDCHGSHNIRKSSDTESTVFAMNSVETCVKCHDHKYQETYEESFHGRAVHLGSKTSATCVSCHGSHAILGPSDAKSSVNKANIPQTCAQCHLKARPNFARGTEHAELKAQGPGAITYWTLKFFTWLTIIVFTLLIIHIELELFRRYQNIKKGKGEVEKRD